MVNEIPGQVRVVFDSFDKNGDGVLSGKDEVVQNNAKRRELGQNSIYSVEEGMDINSFYEKNKALFEDKAQSTEEYYKLYAESQFREADSNGNGKISGCEAKKAGENTLIGKLFKPKKGETLEEYKSRVLPEVMKGIKGSKIGSLKDIFNKKLSELGKKASQYVNDSVNVEKNEIEKMELEKQEKEIDEK